ncbi:hypothetical protein ACFQPA_21840 [Halomarina halobia]|uniref:Uncharacterized protein n=1 Tax=Halomarina halobia TaxID=3033386 RepID=A0ABD6AHA7_9EURY|nr:hypothetical protein [Halomarina sp. PSR21]
MTDASPTTDTPETDSSDADSDVIVLGAPTAFATIGDPTDPDGERLIELPEPDPGEDVRRFELPAAQADAAHALLRKHPRVTVLSNPTERDLSNVKSRMDLEKEWQEQQARKHQRRREKQGRHDPAEDRPANRWKLMVNAIYDRLVAAGDEEAAARLRDTHPLRTQKQLADRLAVDLEEEG